MRVTLAILSYNQESYIDQAVRGALAQTYSPLEIVVSDDCSTDVTFDTIKRSVGDYVGQHELVLNRNDRNLGVAGNVNRVMEISSGDVVLLAGGDDISLPNRAARSAECLMTHDGISCVNFGTIQFHGDNLPADPASLAEVGATRYRRTDYLDESFLHFGGASRGFRREVWDMFGPINEECPTEDSVMLLRCFLLGDVLQSDEVQVLYRVHGENLYSSDKKYHIDLEAIHRQYLKDLSLAEENKLLSSEESALLTSLLEGRLRHRKLVNDRYLASKSLSHYFRHFALASSVSMAQRLKTLGVALKNSKW